MNVVVTHPGGHTSVSRENHISVASHNFFWDTPWGKVPPHRLGVITSEPRYSGGLLGGSKLAALAARRKQKQETPAATEGVKAETDKAVALLDRLSVKNESTASPIRGGGQGRKPLGRYPRKRSPSPTPIEPELEEPVPEPATPVIEFPDLRATPSMFASTLCGPSDLALCQSACISSLSLSYTTSKASREINAKDNPFAGPSPDDIVQRAQARSGGHG